MNEKLRKKLIALLFMQFMLMSAIYATDIVVSGRVLDVNNIPIQSVTVFLKNSTIGTVTDTKGEYSIKVPSGQSVLVYKFIGYEQREELVGKRNKINVVLKENIEQIEEVVIVGYGTIRKSDMTGSSATLKTDRIAELNTSSFEQAMQGRMAGVVVSSASGEPGGGINISIRGNSSIEGGNQPLFVIDGIPMFNENGASEFEDNSSSNYMAMLNPNDIASIEVLKDASSTAIYGSRGANGVVLVTTKQGQKGLARIQILGTNSISFSNKYYDLVNASQYATYINDASINSNRPGGKPYNGQEINGSYFPTPEEIPALIGEGTDWQKSIRRVAYSKNYQLTVSGGNDRTIYLISGGLSNEEGILLNTNYDRYSIRANISTEAKKWLQIKWNTNAAVIDANRTSTNPSRSLSGGPERNSNVYKSLMTNPVLPLDHTLFKSDEDDPNRVGSTFGVFNPYLDAENEIFKKRTYNMYSNVDFIFSLMKDLKLTVRGNASYFNDLQKRFWNENTAVGWKVNGKYLDTRAQTFKLINENFLNYNKIIDKHSINAMVGCSFEKSNYESLNYGLIDYILPVNDGTYLNTLAQTADPAVPTVGATKKTLISEFARLSYSYNDKYLLTATIRNDGSSVFSDNKKWATFPSVGIGWNFAKETFFRPLTYIVSKGKLKYSYGTSGNQAIPSYGSIARLSTITRPMSTSGIFTGVVTGSHPGNPNLTWETTKQHNIGVELGFLNNRLTLGVDMYQKTTENLLQTLSIASQTGYTSFIGNAGSIRNKGLEFELGAIIINNKDLSWNVITTLSANRSKVLDLGSRSILSYYSAEYASGYVDETHRITVGSALGNFFGLRTNGLLTSEDVTNHVPMYRGANQEGMLKYVDRDGNGSINLDGDGEVLGNANPDFVCGLSSTIRYKYLTLSFLITGSLGSEILNMNRMLQEFGNMWGGVPTKDYYNNYWTPDRPDAYYPKPYGVAGMSICDRLIEDGSYVRLSNLTLRFDAPLEKIKWLSKASVFCTATNLITITNYSGYDPEVSAYGSNMIRGGVDHGSYPRPKSISLGVELTF